MIIRDSDGKDPEKLTFQLCQYYDERNTENIDKLPKVRHRNVLILKYYSFENYLLNPSVMAQIGIVDDKETFLEAFSPNGMAKNQYNTILWERNRFLR